MVPDRLLRLLEDGSLGFDALEEDIDGVSRKELSQSRSDLQGEGVVERTVLVEDPTRVEYSLADCGRASEDAFDELDRWGRECLRETDGTIGASTPDLVETPSI